MHRALLKRTRQMAGTAAIALAASIAACGDDSTGPDGRGAGTYRLDQVNDAALPGVVRRVDLGIGIVFEHRVTSGSITLDDDGTFEGVFNIEFATNGEVEEHDRWSVEFEGTYALRSDVIEFTVRRSDSGDVKDFTAVLADGRLTTTVVFMSGQDRPRIPAGFLRE